MSDLYTVFDLDKSQPLSLRDIPFQGNAVSLRSPGSLSGFPYLLGQIPAPVAALMRLNS